jgi:hypothetical protein
VVSDPTILAYGLYGVKIQEIQEIWKIQEIQEIQDIQEKVNLGDEGRRRTMGFK